MLDKLRQIAEEHGHVKFTADGFEYELQQDGDEWHFVVDGDSIICYAPDLDSALDCIETECGEVESVEP